MRKLLPVLVVRHLCHVGAVALVAATVIFAVGAAGAEAKSDCKKNVAVTDLGDSGGRRQLREAIDTVCNGGTIRIRPGTISLERGEMVIPTGKTVTMIGLPPAEVHPRVTIDAQEGTRVMTVQPSADLTLSHVTLTGGVTVGHGGGIYVYPSGSVTLNDSTITDNIGRNGGGMYNWGLVTLNGTSSVTGNTGYSGGGIYTRSGGLVTLNDTSSVTGNTARNGGGILVGGGGSVTLNGTSTITGNSCWYTGGGGILNYGTVTLNEGSTITHNTSPWGGGGIHNYATVTIDPPGRVAIYDNTPMDCWGC